MKKVFFILTVILVCSALSARAWSQEVSGAEVDTDVVCGNMEISPEVVFTTSYGKLAYDYGSTTRALTSIGKRYGIVEKGLFAAGLATVGVNWEISVDTISRIISEDNICVIPVKVDIFIGYEDPVIYVSKDLKPESCEYNVVLRHEQTHQQINKLALDYFIPKLKAAVEQISKDVRPTEIQNLNQIDNAAENISNEYVGHISPLVEHFKKELLSEHSKLDNPENYKHEGDICK
ncbi:MAG: hypothetical protein LBR70_02530 [Lactobacillaceae bacterium]|jgi:hypothetical protein|nr:hypothetical protein [Lactobacillaceae bacterium]